MKKIEIPSVDAAAQSLLNLARKYSAALISTVAFGLISHMYMLTNKLLNADEAAALFSKGATLISGRWALEWCGFLFPDYSMPWLYGLLSILFIAVSVCVTVSIFNIKSPVFQALLGAAAVSSPVVAATMCYMFTSAPYSLAILLSVLAVYLVNKGGRLNYLLGCVSLCVSLGFYQAYIALSASFFVVLLLQKLLCEKLDWLPVLKLGIRFFVSLLIGLAIYGAVTAASLYFTKTELLGYGYSSGILSAFRNCYSNVFRTLFSGYGALVPNTSSCLLHIVILLCGAASAVFLLRKRPAGDVAMALFLFLLLPIAINCLYFAASVEVIHTLVKVGYVSVYIFCIAAAEPLVSGKKLISWLLALSLLCISCVNACYDNECYLKMHIQYENAYAYYSGVAEDVRKCEGYDGQCRLAMVNYTDNWSGYEFENLDTSNNIGLSANMVRVYSRSSFLRYYIGLDMPVADWDEIDALKDDPRVAGMPAYPQDGYVKRIDGYIVVKIA